MRQPPKQRIGLGACAAFVLLAACQSPAPSTSEMAIHNLQAQRESVLAAADWTRMQDLTVEMLDRGYVQRELRLKVGQPYRLRLVNNGGVNHYFMAPEFFAAVAARKAEVPRQAEVKAPVFTGFEVFARGGAIDVYIVPMIKGTYRAHCHLKDHLALGIESTLVIE